eukprot:161068_1
MSQIKQLVVHCHTDGNLSAMISARNNTNYESYSFWSAYAVELNNNNLYGESPVFPGGVLKISYRIIDKFGNNIDICPYDIVVYLLSTELNTNSYLTIESNHSGNSNGLYLQ